MDPFLLLKSLSYNPIKLDGKNYIYWKTQIIPLIRSLGLEALISAPFDAIAPPEFIETTRINEQGETVEQMVSNPKFLEWEKSDQVLLGWLISTIDETLIGQITQCRTSYEFWLMFDKLYRQQSIAKILQLRQQLQSVQKQNESITDFCLKIKSIGDALRASGESVKETELLMALMNGLDHEYDSIVSLIIMQQDTMSLENAQGLLVLHEQRLQHLHSARGVVHHNDEFIGNMVTQQAEHRYFRGSRGSYRGRFRGGRGRYQNTARIFCQICAKPGHNALQCYQRYERDYQRPNHTYAAPNNHNQALLTSADSIKTATNDETTVETPITMIATPAHVSDDAWYLDSGATNHVTNDQTPIIMLSEYTGADHPLVGNGERLAITGCGNLQVAGRGNVSLLLKHVLVVPGITKRLISISKLKASNDVYCVFYPSKCLVKDSVSHNVVIEAHIQYGLYKVVAPVQCMVSQMLPSVVTHTVPNSADVWHAKLGHPTIEVFRRVMQQVHRTGSGGNSAFISELIERLHSVFALKDLGSLSYFVGFEARRTESGLFLSQAKYVRELIEKAGLSSCKSSPTPLATNHKLRKEGGVVMLDPSGYRSLIGGLQYVTHTRPDISFAVNHLSKFLASPTNDHWHACKRVLRFLHGTVMNRLFFSSQTDGSSLEAYCDADWAADPDDRRSVSGSCVFYGGSLISWSSKKQSVVARSSTEAEYRSMSLLATEVIWIQSLLKELKLTVALPIPIWCDNMSANQLAKNPVLHSRTKHVEIDVHFIREKITSGLLSPCYIPTSSQPADIFTKALSLSQFSRLSFKLGLQVPPSSSLMEGVNGQENVPIH